MTEFMFGNNLDDCQYSSTTNPLSSKPTKVNLATIPNPNRLLAGLIIVDEGEVISPMPVDDSDVQAILI